jgi:anti-sigma B factor antagonist
MEANALPGIEQRMRTARIESDTYLVEVEGELDLYSAPDLLRCFERLTQAGARVLVVDLTRTTFMDSTGLGVLVAGTKLARLEHGDLHIVGVRPATAAVLDNTGLRSFLSVLPKVADALERG